MKNNLGIWILIGLLAYSIYAHYRTGEKLEKVCIDVITLEQGYLDLKSKETYTPSGIDMNAIMLTVKDKRALLESNTSERRAYRWYRTYSDELKNICNDRLAEVNDH